MRQRTTAAALQGSRSGVSFRLAAIFVLAGVISPAQAQLSQGAAIEQQQLQRQQEREQDLRERMAPHADTLRPESAPAALSLPPNESPCFAIHALQLSGEHLDQVPWLQDAVGVDWSTQPCLGAKGVEVVLARMQQAVLAHGYVTSRVMAVPQNLQEGVLRVVFVAGVLREVRFSPDSTGETSLLTALPSPRGPLLQLRDIEQGLENLKRVPTSDADIQIVPAEGVDVQPGQSDLVISYKKTHPLRLNLSLDNGGTKPTGKNQGTATLSWDNPLGLNDLLYVSAGGGIGNGGQRGTQTRAAQYSVPWGYWLVALTGSYNEYHQSVAGAYQNYTYSGESSNVDLKLSRVVFRNASSKTTVGIKAFQRTSNNYINDVEIDVQRRRTSGFELSLNQRSYLGTAVVDANLAFKRGTGAFAALHAPEELFGEGTSRMKLYIADLALTKPFEVAGTKLKFSSAWHGQWNKTPLTPQDRIGAGATPCADLTERAPC
jgi:hemolysin activation/secretion protein